MIVGIHQPNFCAWLPLLRKIAACDVFVILSYCQFEKGGFQNRFNFSGQWFSMSVNSGLEPIRQKRYVSHLKDWNRIKARLPEFRADLALFDSCFSESLWLTNWRIINLACALLGIKTPIAIDWPTENTGTDRLVEICRHFGATEYLAGSSGPDYLEIEKFGDIRVRVQEIQPEDRISLMEAIRAHRSLDNAA